MQSIPHIESDLWSSNALFSEIYIRAHCLSRCGIFEILRTLQYTYISNLPEFSVGSRISQREAPTSEVRAPNHYLAKVLLKTAWKLKKLDREGDTRH